MFFSTCTCFTVPMKEDRLMPVLIQNVICFEKKADNNCTCDTPPPNLPCSVFPVEQSENTHIPRVDCDNNTSMFMLLVLIIWLPSLLVYLYTCHTCTPLLVSPDKLITEFCHTVTHPDFHPGFPPLLHSRFNLVIDVRLT